MAKIASRQLKQQQLTHVYNGLFPGLVYCSTFWYKSNERSIRVALILASATLASAIAYGIKHMNKAGGVSAWRWLFIKGIPSVISAFFVCFFLPDFPDDAKWPTVQERDLAVHACVSRAAKTCSRP